jgi:ElaB/YqjD/DUF883 family membrane-anchored ribosome-binding protein
MNDMSAEAGAAVDEVKNELDRGQSKMNKSAENAKDDLSQELRKIRDEMSSMQKIISGFASSAGNDAKRMAQNIGAQVGDIAGDMASGARDQAKTFAAELEEMARRSPLSTIGGALLIGVVIGLVSRGRG